MKYAWIALLLLLASSEVFAKRMVELKAVDKIIIDDGTSIEKVGASLKFACSIRDGVPRKAKILHLEH